MASGSKTVRPSDPNFEKVALQWYNECQSDFSDHDDEMEDPDYCSDHDSTSEIENYDVSENDDLSENNVAPENEEPEHEHHRAYYGKDRFKWAMTDFVKRKKRDSPSCPLCGLTISLGNLETHFMHELERLYKLSGSGVVASRKRNRPEPTRMPALPGDSGPEGRFETFQRIRANRQGRLRMKIRKRKTDDLCPICSGHPQRTQEEINLHVERCVKNAMNDEDETVDVESDFELEEWQESQRRRSSLVGGIMIPTSTGRTNVDNEGDDVIVDGNEPEESIFGPSQYSENDVVFKENKDKDAVQSQVATVNSSGDVEIKMESDAQQCDSNVTTSDAEPSSRAQIINKLRSRIKQLESEGELSSSTDSEGYKCLICLEHFKNPVISTVCWHVHCEECWLHTLGIKKVCPQCSMITSPTDLRRIFMSLAESIRPDS